jgi:regulator of protease activity HflC (stomatin/prohibitin superfamily)
MNWEYLLDPQGGLPIFIVVSVLLFSTIIAVFRSIRIVPAQSALIVERLGKYAKTIEGGFHLLVPFIDRVRYTHNLKEQAIDVPTQPCFTHDNVKVDIDGVLYYRVVDPKRASYGITNYRMGTIQLAQTTMRSVIGQLALDKTFEERESINAAIMQGIDEATEPWGVKITRYEIQNIRVPPDILGAMEAQMKAERDKRAAVARSIGEMESRINYSLGEREEAVNKSEGEKQRLINEAEGQAEEIRALARATAAGIRAIAGALEDEGAEAALVLQISEEYIRELKKLAKPETNVLLPMDLTNINAVLETVTRMVAENKEKL